ncbi:MAG: peptidoglycan DD-metalloendopeptidase family protein [Chloroflexi bacterium]|nr:peptidoglycan DD-metalloendopeptidase family protein [Chloroflexota bacterium]
MAFHSNASNLISGDTNGKKDVFVHKNNIPVGSFLDLPFQYTNFAEAAKGSNSGGYVNSWFDHTSPGFGNDDGNLTTWLGHYTGSANIGRTNCNTSPGGFGISCYDSHDGIDFKHVSDEVLAAAPGKVFGIGYQPSGFGNFLYIDHDNCYASFYAHLKNAPTLQNGDTVTDRQQIGIMGNTGLSLGGGGGVHLHFGLYYDPTCDGNFSDKVVVDPYGWSGTGVDPYTTGASRYLWKHAYDFTQQSINNSGGNVSTPSGNLAVTVPAGAVVNPITLELWNTPPVAGAPSTLRSSGNSFWVRVLEWLTGASSPSQMAKASTNMESAATNSFDLPLTITLQYDSLNMPHLDTSQLTINQWDDVGLAWVALPTTLDTVNQEVSAQASQPGHFDLQAPLVCPADTLEPNDNYDGTSVTQTDGTLANNLFDIASDEDWFKFEATTGNEYVIQTTSLSTSVDTILEIYDTDGVTLLESNDNGGGGNASSLTWQTPQDGLYFARVTQASGSSFGCDSTYYFSVTTLDSISPTVNTFTATSPSNSLNISITDFTASDLVGVTGYLVTESATPPAVDDLGWTGAAPTVYAVISDGSYTLYPWAKDAAGNISSVFASPPVVVVDTTKPTVNTFTATTPSNSFNIPITAFTATDNFGVTGYLITTSATSPAIDATGWTGTAPTTYTVSNIGNFTLYPWVKDTLGNISTVFISPRTVVVDLPITLNITRAAPNPAKATSVKFMVTFSKPVTGVDKTDFSLTTTGITKAAVSKVSGSGANYTVTASTGSGSGTLHLNLLDNDSIKDAGLVPLGGVGAGNGNFTTGDTFTIDKVKPIVLAILRASSNPTSAASVDFTVTFSEPVTGVDIKDFKLIGTGSLAKSKPVVTGVSGSGATYMVTATTGTSTAPGTMRLDLMANKTIKDATLNLLTTSFKTGLPYVVDRAPVVVSIVRGNPNPTKLAAVKFTVKFSEAVTGVNASDFNLSTTLTGTSIVSITGSGTTWMVIVNTGTGSGTLRLDLIDNDSIVDIILKPLGGAGVVNGDFTGQVYNVR